MNARSIIPINVFDASTTQNGATIALPPKTFSDPDFFDFEMDAVWGHEWICIGHVSDIPNAGDYYTIAIGKDPLMVVRQQDGSVKVLGNVCQHRGLLLAEGRGNVRRIRCPMHSWVYDLSGALVSAPGLNDDQSFDKKEACLPVVRSEIWEGFLFISFDESISPLAPRLERLKAQLANYQMSALRGAEPLEMELNDWNWKQYMDECYHCLHLHGQSWGSMHKISAERLDEDTIYNDTENGIIAYDLVSEFPDASPTKTGKAVHPILPNLTEEQRSRLPYITVAPNLLIVAMPDKVKYFLWLPHSATQSWYSATWMYPESTLSDPEFKARWQQERDELYPVMIEDYTGWRRYQVGGESRFAARGRLSSHEKVIGRYQDWLVSRYRKGAGSGI
jgi:phenylpropionate dioxygenase-like ring-hydroxylating dioxygenase large terminal subunit